MTASRARRRALDARRAERAPSSRVMSRIAARGDARAASHTRVCAPSHKALGDALYERRVGATPRRARSRTSACERGVRKRDGCGRVARVVRADARARDATTRARMYDDRFATLARRAGRRARIARTRARARCARRSRRRNLARARARLERARAFGAVREARCVARARTLDVQIAARAIRVSSSRARRTTHERRFSVRATRVSRVAARAARASTAKRSMRARSSEVASSRRARR